MSLNLFLPFAKPAPKGSPSGAGRFLRPVLAKLGPTWLASPVRRLIQSIFFLFFLVLFFYVSWPYGSPDYVKTMQSKEMAEAETFLDFDPLVPITTALAAKTWVWAPPLTHIIIWLCILYPRMFCGYICPFGALIDLFDRATGRRSKQSRASRRGGWVHLKYYLLIATLAASAFGVLIAGFVAAIPVLTRGMMFLFGPLQIGLLKGWYLIPPMNAGHYVSIALFLAILVVGFLRRRFWCRHVCPTGAFFAACNVVRLSDRRVNSRCIRCGRCAEACPFDAIKGDYTTRTAECTFCQTCGGVCPTQAIQFVSRWNRENVAPPAPVADEASVAPAGRELALSRRGFLAGALGGVATAAGVERLWGARVASPDAVLPVRPPGSVPEREFLQMCIRCGECFQACPNNVLQPVAFEQGLEGVWTPQVVAKWSGCEPRCNNCGQVCPTGAIRPLPIEEKRVARIGLAIVNEMTCLPYARREACQMCVDECRAAGYDAIEFLRVGTEVDNDGKPIEDTGFLAPVVLADKCIGCGLCETRCWRINVIQKRLLDDTAIHVVAGPGREDRLMGGSYLALRESERRRKKREQDKGRTQPGASDTYLPDFLK